MKMKLILSMAFSVLTASLLYALEFYDVSRPDIAKICVEYSFDSKHGKAIEAFITFCERLGS